MPELVAPSTAVHASFLKAMDEFQAEGRGSADDDTMVGVEIRDNRATWHDDVLVTCDSDNVASRKVIEANGGWFEDERDGKLRFWVPSQSKAALARESQ